MQEDLNQSLNKKFTILSTGLQYKTTQSKTIGSKASARIPTSCRIIYLCNESGCGNAEDERIEFKGIGLPSIKLFCQRCGNQDIYQIPRP